MKELLYQYNPWWEGTSFADRLVPRDRYLRHLRKYLDSGQIVFLSGLRRVGKTSLMKLLLKELIDSGISPDHIFYVSLDDYLLRDKSISEIVTEFRNANKLEVDEEVYLFLDEVASKSEFSLQLKNLYDLQKVKIFAASSSATMLRDEKANLTGRSVTIEIKPLDLEEFLAFRNVSLKKRDNSLLKSYFLDYIRIGGLPENVLNPGREYLMNLVDDIIQKDITAFHGLKDHQVLRDYFSLLMERSGKQLSVNKMARILNISPDTSKRYLGYFESSYLIHLVPRWGGTNQKLLSQKKIYASDLGIKFLFIGERDLGSYFENYICLKLRRRKEIYYLYEDGAEIDFISSDGYLVESKYYSGMTEKQQKLYDSIDAKQKMLIDSVEKLELLNDM